MYIYATAFSFCSYYEKINLYTLDQRENIS